MFVSLSVQYARISSLSSTQCPVSSEFVMSRAGTFHLEEGSFFFPMLILLDPSPFPSADAASVPPRLPLHHCSLCCLYATLSTLDQLLAKRLKLIGEERAEDIEWKASPLLSFPLPFTPLSPAAKTQWWASTASMDKANIPFRLSPWYSLELTSNHLIVALLSNSGSHLKVPFLCSFHPTTWLLFEVAWPEGIFDELVECWAKAVGSQVIDDRVNCTRERNSVPSEEC